MIKAQDFRLIYRISEQWSPRTVTIRKAGGQTNKNWIVEHKEKKFFVRLPWDRSDMIDRGVEGKNIAQLAKNKKVAKILPRYHLYIWKGKNILEPKARERFDLPDGTMMTEYIEGRELDGKLLRKKEIQKALLQTLHTFHTSGVKFTNRYNVFRDELEKYRKVAKKYQISKIINQKVLSKIEIIEKEAKKKFSPGRGISTHNDLIFENLFLGKDGTVYLLDFEYGGFNLREGLYYDLGIVLGGNLFYKNPITVELFEKILKLANKIYKEKLDEKKIYYGALTNIMVMFWWGLIRYFSVETARERKYFKTYVKKRARGVFKLYRRLK